MLRKSFEETMIVAAPARVLIDEKFGERKNSKNGSPRKRKFKQRFHESTIVKPRPIIPVDESETDSCVLLWRSVIVQALYDISGKSGSYERRLVRTEALNWFFAPNGDSLESEFEQICHLANLAPGKIRQAVKEIREKGEELFDGFNFRTVRRESSRRRRRKSRL